MSSLNYREWDIFINERIKTIGNVCNGHYACYVPTTTMACQTIGMLNEGFELQLQQPVRLAAQVPPQIAAAELHPSAPALPIKIYGQFDPAKDAREQIDEVIDYLNALAICVDFPFHVQQVHFMDHQEGLVMQAVRKPFGRGVGLEVEERAVAYEKLASDFAEFRTQLGTSPSPTKVAIRHYLTGMTLLSLEDQAPGLVDAAFMQFYQGIEALLGKHQGEDAKQAIAKLGIADVRVVQIVCHQVFAVRHKYFGHGNETAFHEIADTGPQDAFRVAKQVLVARWLCRALIDNSSTSHKPLFREMRLYGASESAAFFGTTLELETDFWVEFGQAVDTRKRECKIYDPSGAEIDTYSFPTTPQP